LAKGELGKGIEEMEIGKAGLEEDKAELARRVDILRGTAVQPYASIAGLLILRIEL
jgi:hypothetical protein